MFIILVLLNILQKLMTLIIILHSEIISCDGNNILSVLKIQILTNKIIFVIKFQS